MADRGHQQRTSRPRNRYDGTSKEVADLGDGGDGGPYPGHLGSGQVICLNYSRMVVLTSGYGDREVSFQQGRVHLGLHQGHASDACRSQHRKRIRHVIACERRSVVVAAVAIGVAAEAHGVVVLVAVAVGMRSDPVCSHEGYHRSAQHVILSSIQTPYELVRRRKHPRTQGSVMGVRLASHADTLALSARVSVCNGSAAVVGSLGL